ncbi:hypothetical protein EV200_103588 [Pedobacter psychrotolerans]|uniref:SPW repeat-containing protein n=1 Tax=Pedobacter psychrotolerans TaxID=1843235 RepID=A0A4R2HGM8_9SPHI|nr:hypothetical protein [Pedobacter psychrotolerans]TCO27254.1 hypothetical protein EV200_103588 [Pedobacter psychrotolerans]GGE60184.1 hypothetical protein GCM10011413_28250 [Pedobacter psychrotolerans]
MKIISPKFHAVLDYMLVMLLLISPDLFGLSETASTLSYALGIVQFLLTICTNFSGGIFKIISLKLHGLIELVVSIILIILAFTVFKGNVVDEMFYACLGLMILIIFTITDYKRSLPVIL